MHSRQQLTTGYDLHSGCSASQHRFFYVKDQCQSLEDAMTTALWDEKKSLVEDVRLDDGTSDIDTLDAFEYTFERDISRFIRYE